MAPAELPPARVRLGRRLKYSRRRFNSLSRAAHTQLAGRTGGRAPETSIQNIFMCLIVSFHLFHLGEPLNGAPLPPTLVRLQVDGGPAIHPQAATAPMWVRVPTFSSIHHEFISPIQLRRSKAWLSMLFCYLSCKVIVALARARARAQALPLDNLSPSPSFSPSFSPSLSFGAHCGAVQSLRVAKFSSGNHHKFPFSLYSPLPFGHHAPKGTTTSGEGLGVASASPSSVVYQLVQ